MVGHPVILRGLDLPNLASNTDGPTVLSIIEQDFLGWFLSKMESEDGQRALGPRDAFKGDDSARLYQPVHRSFNLVAVEVACEVEGLPRLDPKKILGAGATLRRYVSEKEAGDAGPGDTYATYASGLYGWKTQGGKVLGWQRVTGGTSRFAPDVSAQYRRQSFMGKNAAVLGNATALIPTEQETDESFVPLFPAPDTLCQKLGKTILFGYLPVTSDERPEENGAPPAPFASDDIAARLPSILWSTGRKNEQSHVAPLANRTVNTAEAASPSAALDAILGMLRYLSQEAGVFLENDENPAAAGLRGRLRQHWVRLHGTSQDIRFWDFLVQANISLLERNPGVTTQRLPINWPNFSTQDEEDLVKAANIAVNARWAQLSPGETRYQNMDARYEVQAFVRVDRSDCDCPPQTVWTAPRREIEIVPWFEGGEAPPTIIELPSPSSLRGKITPNVAFKVPEEIQKFMSGLKLDKLLEGEQPPDKMGWGMICGFSIPIITICAFIVLQIFLSLFHILFWWLPFVRICIPFPKK